MFYALGAAIANIIATTTNKHLLSKERMGVISFGIWLFILLALISGLSLPWLGWIDFEQAVSIHYTFMFVAMLLLACTWNYFYYNCLQKDTLAEFQLVSITQPLMTIFLSMLIFPGERSEKVFVATIVAGFILIASHMNRWKIEQFSVTITLFTVIFLASIESLYHKELLEIYSPAALYFARAFFIAIIFFLANPTDIKKVNYKNLIQTFLIALFAVVTMLLSFYGYQMIGVAKTNIILLFYPIGATIISVYLLKERIKKRKLVALAIIVLCIIYAFMNGG